MGRIGEVLSFRRVSDENGNAAEVQVDLGGGDIVTAEVFLGPGDDEHPLAGDSAFLVEGPGTGGYVAVGFLDPKLPGTAGPGERIWFSRSGPGSMAAKIHAKSDGSVVINDTVTIAPDGSISATSLETSGDIDAGGTVSAPEVAAGGVGMAAHVHPVIALGSPSGGPQAPSPP